MGLAMDMSNMHKHLVKIGPVVPAICLRSDRHTETYKETNRHVHHSTSLSHTEGGVPNEKRQKYVFCLLRIAIDSHDKCVRYKIAH